jgi:hypothetical protein
MISKILDLLDAFISKHCGSTIKAPVQNLNTLCQFKVICGQRIARVQK